jgi:protein-tyrosine phosphatase
MGRIYTANQPRNAMQTEDTRTRKDKKIKIIFVCLGNICRSPLAEGVFRHKVREAGLEDTFDVASAGTGSWHVGEPPDRRMTRCANRFGVSLDGQLAQQFAESHLAEFDYIFAMDKNNLHDILYLDSVDAFGSRVRLFREFDPEPGDYQVPDPYYGGDEGFVEVYQIVARTSERIIEHIVREHGLTV